METVGAYEAKTHLPKLLERVAKGERIVIEKHGVPVAVLQPVEGAMRTPVSEVIADLHAFRAQHRLDGLSVREMIDQGRR
ncbi:MAG: type II toxin-antitoxin system prevent-host-death family antitoxin [Candidatus Hydrogenedens sp.]|nr:type II toxin-antitoxin system prevent-host-death family antitoxin [Candidatus Hydrogenedens sp.]